MEAAAGRAGIVKPQVAFFERFGSAGYAALEEVLAAARAAGLLVIADAKRGDIGTSVTAYAEAWLTAGLAARGRRDDRRGLPGRRLARRGDAAGRTTRGKGLFVLAATSNPEAAAVQQAIVQTGPRAGQSVARAIIEDVAFVQSATVAGLAAYGSIGLVLGATVDLGRLRDRCRDGGGADPCSAGPRARLRAPGRAGAGRLAPVRLAGDRRDRERVARAARRGSRAGSRTRWSAARKRCAPPMSDALDSASADARSAANRPAPPEVDRQAASQAAVAARRARAAVKASIASREVSPLSVLDHATADPDGRGGPAARDASSCSASRPSARRRCRRRSTGSPSRPPSGSAASAVTSAYGLRAVPDRAREPERAPAQPPRRARRTDRGRQGHRLHVHPRELSRRPAVGLGHHARAAPRRGRRRQLLLRRRRRVRPDDRSRASCWSTRPSTTPTATARRGRRSRRHSPLAAASCSRSTCRAPVRSRASMPEARLDLPAAPDVGGTGPAADRPRHRRGGRAAAPARDREGRAGRPGRVRLQGREPRRRRGGPRGRRLDEGPRGAVASVSRLSAPSQARPPSPVA